MSGSTAGLTEQDVRNHLGKPDLIIQQGRVRPVRGFEPEPSESVPPGGKVLIYRRIAHCAYVYVDRNDRVAFTFLAHRF